MSIKDLCMIPAERIAGLPRWQDDIDPLEKGYKCVQDELSHLFKATTENKFTQLVKERQFKAAAKSMLAFLADNNEAAELLLEYKKSIEENQAKSRNALKWYDATFRL